MKQFIVKLGIITFIIILFVLICFFYKKFIASSCPNICPDNGTTTAENIPRVSREARQVLESLVDQVPGSINLIATNKEKDTFVILYKKGTENNWVNYIAIALGKESEKNFKLVLDEKVPVNSEWGFSIMEFLDFNNDGLIDIYVGTYTDQRSVRKDGFLLLQEKPSKFVLANKESADLFQCTNAPGVGPRFIDIDGDGLIEIVIPDVQNYDDANSIIVTKILKLKGEKFILWMESSN